MVQKPDDDIVLLSDWQRAKEICNAATEGKEDACKVAHNDARDIDLDLGCEWTVKPQNYDRLTNKISFKGGFTKKGCHSKVNATTGHATDVKVAKTEFEYEKMLVVSNSKK